MSSILRAKLSLNSIETLRKFVRETVQPGSAERDHAGTFPSPLLAHLHCQGWLRAMIPARFGGSGVSSRELAIFFRELAYGSRGLATALTAHLAAMTAIHESGNDDVANEISRQAIKQPCLACFCFTEPESGSDVSRISARAERCDGGYRISGRKCFITNSGLASHLVVLARLIDPGSQFHEKLALFYLPAEVPGVRRGNSHDLVGHREAQVGELCFNDVYVPNGHKLTDNGLRVMQIALQRSRTMFAAAANGLCDRIQDLLVHQLSNRVLYGKPLVLQPLVRSTLAQLQMEQRAAWYLACAAADAWDEGNRDIEHSCMAKAYAGQIVCRAASQAQELLGSSGYTRVSEIELLHRDARLYQIIEGPTQVLLAIVANEVLPQKDKRPKASVNEPERQDVAPIRIKKSTRGEAA